MMQRLQKILSAAGVASRRASETMINEGRVTINGKTATLGMSADPDIDEIALDGELLAARAEKTYVMLNKPTGYVTTMSDEKGRKTVAELVAGVGIRLYPVGRLDMDSEGLLIMTNDGETANRLMHPSHMVKKVYNTWVFGEDIHAACDIMRSEMIIDGYTIRPAKVEILEEHGSQALLAVTIGEGRNRQVRKMCARAGLRVQRLCRVSEGALRLGELPAGQWRELTPEEVEYIRSIR